MTTRPACRSTTGPPSSTTDLLRPPAARADLARMGDPHPTGPEKLMRVIAAAFAFLVSLGATAQPLPPAAPEDAGFSREGLARIDRFFQREIAQHRVPGAVVAIARDGKLVYYRAFGKLSP